jgi:hypothetical protein
VKIKNKLVRNLTTSMLVAAASLLSATSMAAPDNVGFVYVSPIGDAGWTFQHDMGRLQLETETGVTTNYVENVAEGADAERVIREMAKRGDKVIFATSFGYMNFMLKVSKTFPNTAFVHATGYKMGKNMGIYNARFFLFVPFSKRVCYGTFFKQVAVNNPYLSDSFVDRLAGSVSPLNIRSFQFQVCLSRIDSDRQTAKAASLQGGNACLISLLDSLAYCICQIQQSLFGQVVCVGIGRLLIVKNPDSDPCVSAGKYFLYFIFLTNDTRIQCVFVIDVGKFPASL